MTRDTRDGNERLFGRQRGHALKARPQRLIETLLPGLRLNVDQPAPIDIAVLFSRPMSTNLIEIGFGGGEQLAQKAERNPDIGFIGCEPFLNGVAKLLGVIETRELDNIRIWDDDARTILDWLPTASMDRADLYYPDPWPKKRHWKRRFIGTSNLDRLARIVKPGGVLRFASDIESYVDWTLRHARAHPDFDWMAQRSRDWQTPWVDWTRTRYEAKAIREGRTPHYLTFQRSDRVVRAIGTPTETA